MDEKAKLTVTRLDGSKFEVALPSGCEDVNAFVLQLARAGGVWADQIFTPMSGILTVAVHK